MSIYFINEQHQINYKRALLKWPQGKTNTEYQTPCYILSVPIIFEKVEEYIGTFETPVDWIWRWEWKYTLSILDEFKGDADADYEIGYDLTGSMVQLGKFALNMWNSYDHFNLMDCIGSLDEDNYKVLKCGMDMRMGYHK